MQSTCYQWLAGPLEMAYRGLSFGLALADQAFGTSRSLQKRSPGHVTPVIMATLSVLRSSAPALGRLRREAGWRLPARLPFQLFVDCLPCPGHL